MRFESFHVKAFGGLRDRTSGESGLGGLVVVYGLNEAGKSTLFHFLSTLLYGFEPAKLERHPYAPWGGDPIEGEAELALDSGAGIRVRRRLAGTPAAWITVEEETRKFANQPLEWTGDVDRKLFRQVHTIHLPNLSDLGGGRGGDEAWQRIQDQLLGSMGAQDLRPPREVAQELEGEADQLWRTTRRGKPRLREMRRRLHELQRARKEARKRDRAIREMDRERRALEEELAALKERRFGAEEELGRLQRLGALRRKLDQICRLRDEAGDPEELKGLPEDPGSVLAHLDEEIRKAERDLADLHLQIAGREADRDAFRDEHKRLLGLAAEIQRFHNAAASLAGGRDELRTVEEDLAELEEELDRHAVEILSGSWREPAEDIFQPLPLGEVEELVTRARNLEQEIREREARAAEGGGGAAWLAGGGALALGGLAILVIGMARKDLLVMVTGSVLAALGAGGVAWALHHRGGRAGGPADMARRERAAVLQRLAAVLEDLPIREELLEAPTPRLPHTLERLRDLLRRRQREREALRELRRSLQEMDEAARALLAALGREEGTPSVPPPRELAAALLEELHAAETLNTRAAEATRTLAGDLYPRRERLQAEKEAAERQAEALRRRLAGLGDGDPERGAEVAVRRLRALRMAREREEELADEVPDLEARRTELKEAQARGLFVGASEDEMHRRSRAISEISEQIETVGRGITKLDSEMEHLLEEPTVEAVASEILALEEEMQEVAEERDRLWLLARIVRAADARFREAHQPDVLRRAGERFSALTGGRYTGLTLDGEPGSEVLHTMGLHLPVPLPLAPPISTGTREQAYLALRLAVVDHLNPEGERLPIFLDEALVNWDPERRARGLDLLAQVADSRQIFVFTCHPHLRDDLVGRGASLVEV